MRDPVSGRNMQGRGKNQFMVGWFGRAFRTGENRCDAVQVSVEAVALWKGL